MSAGRDDERAQAIQVGAVLILGIIVLTLASFQVTVVPQENEEVEFNSYLEATSDMKDVRNDVLTAGQRGVEAATTVETGTTYPARALFVNPPPATGRITTTDNQSLAFVIWNASAGDSEEGNVKDFWSTRKNYTTKRIVFDPSYNNFNGLPMAVSSIGVTRYAGDDRTIGLSSQSLISDNSIKFLAIRGNVSAGGLSTSLSTVPKSAAKRTITITNDTSTGNITLSIPFESGSRANAWNDSSIADNIRQNKHVNKTRVGTVVYQGRTINVTNITLQNGTYELTLGLVEAKTENSESEVERPSAKYIVTAEGNESTVAVNQSNRLVAEVRDRFNNPVSGKKVTFETNDGEFSNGNAKITVTTNSDGRAPVSFTPNATGSAEVNASFTGSTSRLNETTFNVSVLEANVTDTAKETFGSTNGTAATAAGDASGVILLQNVEQNNSTGSDFRNVTITLKSNATKNVSIEGIRLSFAVQFNTNGEVTDGPKGITGIKVKNSARGYLEQEGGFNASEQKQPVFFDNPNLVFLNESTSEVDLRYNTAYSLGSQEAFQTKITIYLENGFTLEYTFFLFS